MSRHLLVVFTNPVAGRENEYNRWYDERHLAEVLGISGFVAATRYKADDAQLVAKGDHDYLAVYEIETDDLPATLEALQNAYPSMDMNDALDMKSIRSWVYTPITERKTA